MATRLAVVIPAYRPSAGLVDLTRTLAERRLPAILVVDDGSGPEYRDIFAQVAEFPNVVLLRHAVNLGKGAALKTAFNHALCAFPDLIGVVTADADGQHDPDDIERIAAALTERPDALVLGAREFSGDVPLRSKIGNVATRGLVHALLGQKLADTQTGLRGIPSSLLPRLLRLESTGYEFELEMLIAAHHLSIPVIERPIRTIYEKGNPTSHFNPLIDSMKIYFVLLRFGSVSMMSALLDNLIFILTVHRLSSLLAAQVISRVFSVAFNYGMVRSSVFYSRQRHKSTLPKYLALTVVSGSLSYGGIHLLSTRFGIGVVAAKLMVETVLFFVNFAVQRAFIFKAENGSPGNGGAGPASGGAGSSGERPVKEPAHPYAYLLAAVFVALVALVAYGVWTQDLFAQDIWNPFGLARFKRYVAGFAIGSAVLIVAARRYYAALLPALLVVLTAAAVGVLPVLSVALFFLSANALGNTLLRHPKAEAIEDQVCATLLGVGLYTFLMTWTARIPVNYPAAWAVLLVAPVLLDLRPALDRFARWLAMMRPARSPRLADSAAFAVLAMILIAHWVVTLKPEVSADGLAMHLAIPANIAINHQMTIEPSRFVWAVMPMAADFSYAIVYLMGGEYASHLVVFTMLLALCGLLYRALRRWTSPAAACLLIAAFATTPLVQLVTGAMFVENFLAAMIFGLLTAVWRYADTGEGRYFYLAMALGGTALSVKLGALAFVALAIPFAFVEARRHRNVAALAGAALLLVTAAPPYAVAYFKTRNPLYPFLNARFHSPLLPEGVDVRDARFKKFLGPRTPYDLIFHTDDYYEGQRGSIGFHWLVLVPLGVAGLAVARRRPAAMAAVVAIGAGAIILRTEPNVRYLYAAMPLSLVPVGATLGWARAHQRGLYRAVLAFVLAATALNTYFLPSASYYHKDFALRQPFSRTARERYLVEAAPTRNLIAYFNRAHPKQTVLFTHEGTNAGIDADVYENHWHQAPNQIKIHEAADLAAMRKLMASWGVRYFISHKPAPGELADPPALAEFLAACTLPEFESGDAYLARLDPDCRAREITEPVITVPPGYYDDNDPALVYRGAWTKASAIHGPDRDTRAFAKDAPASVSMAFEGGTVYFMFGKGPNYGIASVSIDGVEQKPVDQYAKDVEWLYKYRYCCFGPGRHVIVIRSSGARNPDSSGYALDVDSISIAN